MGLDLRHLLRGRFDMRWNSWLTSRSSSRDYCAPPDGSVQLDARSNRRHTAEHTRITGTDDETVTSEVHSDQIIVRPCLDTGSNDGRRGNAAVPAPRTPPAPRNTGQQSSVSRTRASPHRAPQMLNEGGTRVTNPTRHLSRAASAGSSATFALFIEVLITVVCQNCRANLRSFRRARNARTFTTSCSTCYLMTSCTVSPGPAG